jgi:hypothetical protein
VRRCAVHNRRRRPATTYRAPCRTSR